MTDDQITRRIMDYWRERGYGVNAAVAQMSAPPTRAHQAPYHYDAIKSDLVNGLPLGYEPVNAVDLAMPLRRR